MRNQPFLETNDNKNTTTKNLCMGCSKNSSKREVYSNTILSQETKTSNRQLTLHLKQLKKENNKTPKFVEVKKSTRSEQK